VGVGLPDSPGGGGGRGLVGVGLPKWGH
jgi:hypothetical protein